MRNHSWAVLFFPLLATLCPQSYGAYPTTEQREAPAVEKKALPITLPLEFEYNAGQSPEKIPFLLQNGNAALSLDRAAAIRWKVSGGKVVTIRPVGAPEEPAVAGEERRLTNRNYYFPGKQPGQFTAVPSFGRIRYRAIYPGIDLVYYGRGNQIEYDYVLAPHADAARIRFAITGADTARIEDDRFVVSSNGRQLEFSAPMAYQIVAGRRHSVAARYRLQQGVLAIEVGDYDHNSTLTIDPTVTYSSYLDPHGQSSMTADIAADPAGNAYVLASTGFATTLDPVSNAPIPGPASCTVSKINQPGSALVYQTTVAVQGDCSSIAVDGQGNAYFAGRGTISPTPGAFQTVNRGTDNFLIKLDGTGQILYATYLGGSGTDTVRQITVDNSGNLAVAGTTNSNDFPVKNAIQPTLVPPLPGSNLPNGFVAVLNQTATALVYSTYLADAALQAIGSDPAGNLFVLTAMAGTQYPLLNAVQSTCPATASVPCTAISKFSPTGALLFSTLAQVAFQGNGADSLAVDSLGTPYVAGKIFTLQISISFTHEVLAKVNPATGAMQQLAIPDFNLAGDGHFIFRVRTDAANNVYIGPAGQTFTPAGQTIKTVRKGDSTPFLSIAADGSVNYQFDPVFQVIGFAGGPAGQIYLAGSPTFTPFFTVAPFETTLSGDPAAFGVFDSFVASISNASTPSLGTQPAAVAFVDVAIGAPASQNVSLLNLSTTNLTISSIAVTGAGFSQTNDCSSPLAELGTCTVNVVFAPAAVSTQSGTLTISSNALNSVQTIALSGNAIQPPVPALSFSSTSLSFGDTPVGGNSSPQTITITNSGTAAVAFSRFDGSAEAIESNNCGFSLSPGANCAVSVVFHPSAAGARTGTVSISDNVSGSPQTINITGTGGSGFVLQSTPAGTTPSATVNAGQSATYNLNVNSVLGFTGAVSFSCSGAPSGASCSVSPSSFSLSANSSVPVSISVSTTARSTAVMIYHGTRFWASVFAVLALFGIWIPTGSRRRHHRVLPGLIGAVLLGIAGCGGGGGTSGVPVTSGTPAGTYTITISGNSGSVSQSTPVVLKVN